MATQCLLGVLGDPIASQQLLGVVAILVVLSFVGVWINRLKKLDLPVVGEPGLQDYRDALLDGTLRYPESPFVIPTAPSLVVLPISTIDEVRNLPENQASFIKEVGRMFLAKYTGIGGGGREVLKAVKVDLNRHIAATLDDLQDEIRYGFDKELKGCEDWTKLIVYHKITRIVALLSARVFVGRPLSREEEWIEASIMYTHSCLGAKDAVAAYPVKRVNQFRKRGGELLKPILDAQMAKDDNQKVHRDDTADEQGTFISWILKYADSKIRSDAEYLSMNQMALSMAAIHTTSMAATAAIYDLAAYPEYIQPLRDEIDQVIDEDGQDIGGDGYMKLKKSSLTKLWRLDSFLKESQRLTPAGLVSNVRITTAPLALSTGHTIPTNVRFGFASHALHTTTLESFSTPLTTPNSFNKPLYEFDALRYYNLRKIPGNENKYQFVTTAPDSLNFGYGNHACPGRFFASNEIKIVLIELLRNWEFRFVDDKKMEGGVEKRPANSWIETGCMPNAQAQMEFRRISKV